MFNGHAIIFRGYKVLQVPKASGSVNSSYMHQTWSIIKIQEPSSITLAGIKGHRLCLVPPDDGGLTTETRRGDTDTDI
jgi:hypothetical protein